MKKPVIYLLCGMILAIAVPGLLLGQSASAFPSAKTSAVSWIDNFNDPILDSRWTWIHEDPTHWSLTTQPGFLRIITQAGGIYGQLYDQGNNILVTDAPLGDFQITTKVTISPTQDYQTAGILYYQDNDNYLNLVYVHDHGTWVSFHKEIGGNVGFIAYPDQIMTSTVYLRIDRQDTAFTGYFSTDGNVWNEVGLQIIAIVNPKVGIDTSNGPVGVDEIPADFDFFKLVGNSTTFLPLILR